MFWVRTKVNGIGSNQKLIYLDRVCSQGLWEYLTAKVILWEGTIGLLLLVRRWRHHLTNGGAWCALIYTMPLYSWILYYLNNHKFHDNVDVNPLYYTPLWELVTYCNFLCAMEEYNAFNKGRDAFAIMPNIAVAMWGHTNDGILWVKVGPHWHHWQKVGPSPPVNLHQIAPLNCLIWVPSNNYRHFSNEIHPRALIGLGSSIPRYHHTIESKACAAYARRNHAPLENWRNPLNDFSWDVTIPVWSVECSLLVAMLNT